MRKVADAAAKLERSERRTEKARQELHATIREAHKAGEAVSLIATVAGVTRQRVWQIVKEGTDDRPGAH